MCYWCEPSVLLLLASPRRRKRRREVLENAEDEIRRTQPRLSSEEVSALAREPANAYA
jgi:hypothetical protein